MKRYGLIGYPLSHSFSPQYFEEKFEALGMQARYDLFPLKNIEDFVALISENDFSGLNVTIPHKEKILAFVNDISAEAKEIGAINTIVFKNKKLIGHNTDAIGFEIMLEKVGANHHMKALVFGTGGASKAVIYVLRKYNIECIQISRHKDNYLHYNDLTSEIGATHLLWINTTPVGMHPNIDACLPLPYQLLGPKHILLDLIYNPLQTKFLQHGNHEGSKTLGGLIMLHAQAEAAWKLWQ